MRFTRNYLIIISMVLAGAVACQSPQQEEDPTGPKKMEVHLAKTDVSAADNSIAVTVDCDWAWKAGLEDTPWAKIVGISQKEDNSGQFTLILELNNAQETRKGTVVVRAGDKEERATFQQHGVAEFFNPGSIVLLGTAESSTQFTSPSQWSAKVTEGTEWLKLKEAQGNAGEVKFSCFAADPNEDIGDRQGIVSITFAAGTLDLPVTQLQKDVIIASEPLFSIGFEGGAFSVRTATNVEYSISPSAGWIHPAGTKALNEFTESFSVDPNEDPADRSAEIVFSDKKNPGVTATVSVLQRGKDPIIKTTVPGFYGIGDKDVLLAKDGWNQSSRSYALNGSYEYRLLNAASLSVLSVSGIDPEAEMDAICTVSLAAYTGKEKTLEKEFEARLVYATDELLYVRADENTWFIIQK